MPKDPPPHPQPAEPAQTAPEPADGPTALSRLGPSATRVAALVVDRIEVAIAVTDADAHVTAFNPAAERQYGISQAEAVGHRFEEIIDATDLEGRPFGDRAYQGLAARGSFSARVRHSPRIGPRRGQSLIVDLSLTTIRGERGEPVGVIGVNRDVTATARLEAELATLGSLAVATGRARSRREIADAALDRLCEATGADAGLILSYDGDRQVVGAARGTSPTFIGAVEATVASSSPVVRELFRAGGLVFVDVDRAPFTEPVRELAEREGLRSVLLVGLQLRGEVTGLLGLGWRTAIGDRPNDGLMRQAAAHIASSLESARLLEAFEASVATERRLNRRLQALVELTRIGGEATSFEELAQRTVRLVREALGAGAVVYGTLADDHYEMAAHDGELGPYLPWLQTIRPSRIPAVRRILAGSDGVLEDYGAATASEEGQALGRRTGYRSFAVVPVRFREELVGILVALFHEAVAELSIDETAVDTVARVAGISFSNFRLRSQLEARAAAQRALAGRVAALDELTLIGEQAGSFQELASKTVHLVRDALGSVAVIYGETTDDDRFTATAWAGDLAVFAAQLGTLRPSHSPAQATLRATGRSVLGDYEPGQAHPEAIAAAVASGIRAYGVIPVLVGDELVGQLFALFREPVAALPIDVGALDSVARVASISLSNFRLRERLGSSEERYRTLFEESPDAVLLCDLEGTVLDANEAALRLFGGDRGALAGRPVAKLGADEEAGFGDRWREAVAAGRTSFRGLTRRLDGELFPADVEVRAIRIAGGQRILVLLRDVSDQERLQQELLQAQKMEALGQLVSGVAHELNNPLTAIVGFSRLIESDPRLPDDMRHDAGLLTTEADRTRRIVGNLLDFARQRAPERHPTQVAALLGSVLDLQGYAIEAARVDVSATIPADLPTVDVDRAQMQQVLLNLILNAIQAIAATGRPGRISVSARVASGPGDHGGPRIRIEVSDDGPGVPPAVAERIFLPFFTTKEPGKGTGLGLSVSFGIVAAHGGRLWQERGPGGRGATFVVELPLQSAVGGEPGGPAPPRGTGSRARRPAPRARRAAAARGASGRDVSPSVAGLSILVLDDEAAIRHLLARILREARVVTAADGAEALERVRERSFDVLLVDHRMPAMTGTQFYSAAVALRPDLADRVVFMSGDLLNPELAAFARAHPAGLPKPFGESEVLRVVAAVARRGPAQRG